MLRKFDHCLPKLREKTGAKATSHNNSVSAPPSAALRFATVLGPGTLSKRLIAFAFLLRAVAREFWNIRSARTAPCGGQMLASLPLRLRTHVMRNFRAQKTEVRHKKENLVSVSLA